MEITLNGVERAALERRCDAEGRTRRWRRYRTLLLLADRWSVPAVAEALDCCRASVWNWARAWREQGVPGLEERPHPGRARLLDAAAGERMDVLLASDPQTHGYRSTGWTVPMLTTELRRQGHAVSARTVRRFLRLRKWRWKRPKYVLGRPDPAYAEKRGP